ncbi:chaperone protein HtpG [Kineosporia sp. NBRC 101677]|uniref:molecular chaperone HtpG n=1 Tax=Kineosporia sp. NBRC 101677 TaxID=3032197 RepID=UPI0024A4DF21|nr:molecular chaperone HtpG [Kineosporia sp. NBRC 101677]GLY19260.1 chaperone protein HtpG [Kineosporia sp. NBRC 101677]
MTTQAESYEFQVETRQLLQLMINSIYSDKDLFLRELISNASDALDKLRLERFNDDTLDVDTSDLHIRIDLDAAARTLTISDNGIGMSRAEVVDLIGKIANSGTAEFMRQLKEAQREEADTEELIGRFGVGFYSSFMVAERVTMITRRAGQAEATRWESAGEATYTLEPVDSAPQGTSITLHLKPADPEDRLFDYTDPRKVREIVTRYSDFITWPIRMAAIPVPGDDDEADEAAEPAEETVNSRKALWTRPAGEVTDEEYAELYKRISHDWNDPLETIRLNIEGTLQYQALLFLPERAGANLFSPDAKHGVQLYVNRVFVMDDAEELLPAYLRFVKGVVDSQDLALNVSREILQQDRQIESMRKRLTKRVLQAVKGLAANEPEKYTKFWGEFGRVVKEGLLQDFANRDAILEICSFESTNDPEKRTSLRDYVERMPEDQDKIYYLTGDSRQALENSPYMEAFRAKELEVLLLTDPIDEVWVDGMPEFDGKQFQSVAKGDIDLHEDDTAEEKEKQKEQYSALLTWMGEVLTKEVKEVRLSSRLTTSPACVVSDQNDATPTLVNLYRAMGQPIPQERRILELNPAHTLVEGLRSAHEARPEDPKLAETVELVHGMALLAEGTQPDDPARFVQLLATQLGETLGR